MDNRDHEAFRALYSEHHPTIRRYLAARVPASQVDDLAAETFLVAWRRAADMPPQALLWLINVATKVLANQRRRTERAEALVERLARMSRLEDPGAAAAAERRAEHLAVLRALARLRPGDCEIMLLSVWDGLQPRQTPPSSTSTPSLRAPASRGRAGASSVRFTPSSTGPTHLLRALCWKGPPHERRRSALRAAPPTGRRAGR